MKKYTLQELQTQFSKLNYKWSPFHIIGVRSKADLPNVFDDNIYLWDGYELIQYKATTNPGTHWLVNWLNPKGTAVLKPDQYVATWGLGLHRGTYEALIQQKPVTVYRDINKDKKSDESGKTDYGLFGINIHRASENGISNVIDKWSAGCQVFADGSEYKDFMKRIKSSGQELFTYTLLREF